MIARKCIHIVLTPFLFFLLFLLISCAFNEFIYVSILFFLIFLFFLFFFRDPNRKIEEGIVSPADGRVMENDEKISIFMNIWDVHVNRAPFLGEIEKMERRAGKHVPAFKEKGGNECLIISLKTEIGIIKIIQIAGICVRRIVPYVKEGNFVKRGDKIGIVRFGSKVEVHMPKNVNVVVKKGDKIKAGQTIGIL